MPNSQLILLEGLSGSGKSTTATYLALEHQHLGIPYRYHWEMEVPHPVNMRTGFSTAPFTPAERIRLGLAKWRAFADYAQNRDKVTILDGKPFHITLLYMILHDNVTQQQLVDYAGQIADFIRPLNPKLLYLRQDDIDQAVQQLGKDRGEAWNLSMIRQINDRQAHKSMDFTGYAGLLRYFEYYRMLLEKGLQAMAIDQLTIDTAAADWPIYYKKIHDFLSLEHSGRPMQTGNPYLCPADEQCPAKLVIENRSDRSLIAYRWPHNERFAEYAFELAPRDVRTYETKVGYRFRLHDTNDGEIIQDVIATTAQQAVTISCEN